MMMTPRKTKERVALNGRHDHITAAHEDQSELIQVARIRTDGGTQMRAALNQEAILEYAEAYANEANMPPLEVMRDAENNIWLWDGFHRLAAWIEAHEQIGVKIEDIPPIPCRVTIGEQRDAILKAAGANNEHGLRRTHSDKRRAVTALLLDSEWATKGSSWIAERCAVSDSYVRKVRNELGLSRHENGIRKVRRGDSVYEMDASNISRKSELTEDEREIIDRIGNQPCIYVLSNGDEYKIGYTKNLLRRYNQTHGRNPRIRLIHAFPGEKPVEARLHRLFQNEDRRVSGEWFALDEDEVEWLVNITDGRQTFEGYRQMRDSLVEAALQRYEAEGWGIAWMPDYSHPHSTEPRSCVAYHHRRQLATSYAGSWQSLLWDLEGERFDRAEYKMFFPDGEPHRLQHYQGVTGPRPRPKPELSVPVDVEDRVPPDMEVNPLDVKRIKLDRFDEFVPLIDEGITAFEQATGYFGLAAEARRVLQRMQEHANKHRDAVDNGKMEPDA